MPYLYLHAGAPKTGTSYLQVLFAKYAEKLAACGIIYPRGHMFNEAKAGKITSGNGVEMANYIRPHLPHQIRDKDAFIHELEHELRAAAGKHVLYSSEFLVFEPGERTSAIARVAAETGYEIRVIYLVRDIAAAAYSIYSQQIKNHGETRTFAEFIRSWDPHYRNTIQKAVDCFGRDAILVHNFEEHRDRLAELFFKDILGADFVPEERATVNRSLSPREAEMLRIMNSAYPKNSKFSTFVANALMDVDTKSETFQISKAEFEYLNRRFLNAVDFINGFVSGQATTVARQTVDQRSAPEISDFERSMMVIMAKLVSAVVK